MQFESKTWPFKSNFDRKIDIVVLSLWGRIYVEKIDCHLNC